MRRLTKDYRTDVRESSINTECESRSFAGSLQLVAAISGGDASTAQMPDKKHKRRGSTEPRRVDYETTKRFWKKSLLLLRGLLLGSGLLRGLLLGSHVLPPSTSDMDPRFHWIGDHSSLAETRSMTCPAPTSSATPRVSPQALNAEDLTTLAAVRDGSLTRVGSVASVVATTSSIAIQVVLIHRVHRVRQWVAKIFFRAPVARKPRCMTIAMSDDINQRVFESRATITACTSRMPPLTSLVCLSSQAK